MSEIQKIKIESLAPTAHKVYVNEMELKNVTGLDIHYAPFTVPEANITVATMPEMDGAINAKLHFQPTDVKSAIQFLHYSLKNEDVVYRAFVGSIRSALDEIDGNSAEMTNEEKAEIILDRVIGDA